MTVEPDDLAADGAVLADRLMLESPPGCKPAGADTISAGVAAQLSAHSAAVAILVQRAQRLRAGGGAVTQHTAASLLAAYQHGAAVIAGMTSGPAMICTPMGRAVVPCTVLPAIPPMPSPARIPGEAYAVALYSGPGAASLREFAHHWQSWAATLDNIAEETPQTAASIEAHWRESRQQAGANAAVHGRWWSDMAGRARALAAAASEAAEHYDRAVAATPGPLDFAAAYHWLAQVKAANVASHGLLSNQVSAAAAHVVQLQSDAIDAAGAYHSAATATMGAIGGRAVPALAIVTGGCSAAAQTGERTTTTSRSVGSAQSALHPRMAELYANAGSTTGICDDWLEQLAICMLPAAVVLPMTSTSALSIMATRLVNRLNEAAPDSDVADNPDDTLPAGQR